ncbi:uncharacterized protein J7T54_008443 [Emericellopsis cladophorae]|uniref:Glycoside hydrolase family 5 domain-containing protein n=1 Tax=Emericellopsis cladophorae TaxID=2686198 RepID=A0A9Q0BDY1_9HYPO|nr:uncharacterized protein J7T54_008443 [Emericellopsis cladophorae]KAI6782357.1 hypothetical protein J7T54_008443 [Emericellopsis cladophorae]
MGSIPASGSSDPCTTLRVEGSRIVNAAGETVVLKGAGVGGCLNMENFITGYAGHEYEHRALMAEVLGEAKAQFFFDRLIHHLFSDDDAAYFASLGLDCIRIPINHRQFMDDMDPGTIRPEGFQLVDRIVDVFAKHNLYTVLDLHTAPGGQNQDWHSDSGFSRAMFWEFKDLQDRAIQLWEALAEHYKGNPYVAGYNPLNETADPYKAANGHHGVRLVAWYERCEKAIRAIDPDHILFVDGNTYAMDSRAFPEKTLPNTVYAIHDYSMLGFPISEQYEGAERQNKTLRQQLDRKVEYMRSKNVPVWNGEFGPVYASAHNAGSEKAAATINAKRISLLRAQLKNYAADSISWSIWLYKDIGYQGMVYVDPASSYMRLIQPFVDKKQALGLDFWGVVNKQGLDALLEKLAASFAFKNCKGREQLNETLRLDAAGRL